MKNRLIIFLNKKIKTRWVITILILSWLFLGSFFNALLYNVSSASYGEIQKQNIDKENIKLFLKDNFKWKLQASINNISWHDANELMTIDLKWIDSDNAYKVTLILNTYDAPQSLYYRFLLAFNKTLEGSFVSNDWKWEFRISEYNFNLFFDWSDIRQLVNTSKVWIDKGIKNGYFWFKCQTVNKIAVDKVFVVDPSTGYIYSVISSYEFDGQESVTSSQNALCRVNSSNYYVTVAKGDTGSDGDGFVRTLGVNPTTGVITASTISKFEYDTSNGDYANIIHIANTDKYAVAYADATKVTVCTLRIYANNGTIQPSIIDSQVLSYNGYNVFLMYLTNNVYCVLYSDTVDFDGFLETIEIQSSGMITNALLDTQEFDTVYCRVPYACIVDTNTVAISYMSGSDTGDYTCVTYNITTLGIITNTPADTTVYESNAFYYNSIMKVGTKYYELVYIDSLNDVKAKTMIIENTGVMYDSFIDSLSIINGIQSQCINIFKVQDSLLSADGNGITGCVFGGIATGETDGYVVTWNVTNLGDLGTSNISKFEFDTTSADYCINICYVNRSIYLFVYNRADSDGFAETINIKTNWATPVVSGVIPINYAVNVDFQPVCYVTTTDLNGDLLDLTWETFTGGIWVTRTVEYGVSNGTNDFIYNWAIHNLTLYSWRISVSDGYTNTTYTYCFTTTYPSNDLDIYENLLNCTGTHETTYTDMNGWNVYNNYTGFSLILTFINNLINCTGTHTSYYNSVTGWKMYLNYTGNASTGGTITNRTINITINGHGFFSSWNGSVNTNIQNISILMNSDKNITGNFTDNTSFYEDKYFLSGTLIFDDFQFSLLILLAMWLFFISKIKDDSIFGVFQLFIGLPLSGLMGTYSYINSLLYGYFVSLSIIIVTLLSFAFVYWKPKNK